MLMQHADLAKVDVQQSGCETATLVDNDVQS